MEHDLSRAMTPEELEDILHSPPYEPWVIADYKHWTLRLMTADQSFLGRSYVWLKRHEDRMSITNLTQDELTELIYETLPAYEKAMRSWYPLDCVNFEWLGNEVHTHRGHGHMHLIPRSTGPVTFNGRTFVDARPGRQRDNEPLELSEKDLKAIHAELTSRING